MVKPKKRQPKRASLLVEIGTEELPPTSLARLGKMFASSLCNSLASAGLSDQQSTWFASPRRLAAVVPGVARRQENRFTERRGPTIAAAFDKQGHPTAAANGFAKACGVPVDALSRSETKSGAWLVFRKEESGASANRLIPSCIESALASLPIAKRMRWGNNDAEFVRPVHWVVVVHGKTVIRCKILGIASGNVTHGHRFLAEKPVHIKDADTYPETLRENGFVLADFHERQQVIKQDLEALGRKVGGQTVIDDELLDTVTGLVEWPRAMIGQFDPSFLNIPKEVLVSSMRDHQKFFHVVNERGKLLPRFVTVANIRPDKTAGVRSGNERVLKARLSDAQFFWNEDVSRSLDNWVEELKGVQFHGNLGSLYDKVGRLKILSAGIALKLGWNDSQAARASHLCKSDLVSQMVNEFPSLQGTMGRYYAINKGEPKEVAKAIEEHYLPRFSGDKLPSSRLGKVLALADRIDTLVGIFSTGEEPTGERDPYGLRRAALGIIRILIERRLPLDLSDLIKISGSAYGIYDRTIDRNVHTQVVRFIAERYRSYYLNKGFANDEINAVLETNTTQPIDFDRRLRAISRFRKNLAAQSLSEANKRVRNILKKTDQQIPSHINDALFENEAEMILAAALVEISASVSPLINRGDYPNALKQLARLRAPVDNFFSDVMVLAENPQLRANRLALLDQLGNLLLVVADISKLQSKST